MKRDEAKKLADNALKDLQQALKAGRSEALERFLNVMSRFHKYSWNNCMLIAVQQPEATHVAGFRNWLRLGRHVRMRHVISRLRNGYQTFRELRKSERRELLDQCRHQHRENFWLYVQVMSGPFGIRTSEDEQ